MSQTCQLPMWVSYLQALAIPIVVLAVTVAGVLIALVQMVIARDRFEVDIFDRQYTQRVAVYEATRQFLEGVFRQTLSEDDVRSYGLRTLDAEFLFDNKMYKYLRELHWRGTTFINARVSIDKPPLAEKREAQERISAEQRDWIIKQGDEVSGFVTRFKPFLSFKRRKRRWLFF